MLIYQVNRLLADDLREMPILISFKKKKNKHI